MNVSRLARVMREDVDACEPLTGFKGIGEFLEKKGLFVFVEDEECKTA